MEKRIFINLPTEVQIKSLLEINLKAGITALSLTPLPALLRMSGVFCVLQTRNC